MYYLIMILNREENDMVIKKFKDSHPSVLVVYFLSIIVLLFIQNNYYFILLMSGLAILMDCFYNKDKFFKHLKWVLIILGVVMLIVPLLVQSSNDIIYSLLFGIFLSDLFLWYKVMRYFVKNDHIVYLFGSILPGFGLTISIFFNFINKLKRQYQKIKEANYHIPVKNKIIYYRNVIIILVTYAFESSLDMIDSMISRGYGSSKRTSFHLYVFQKDDMLKLAIIVLLSVICFWGYYGYYRNYPLLQIYHFKLLDLLFFTSYLLLGILPILLGGKKNV